MQLGELDQRGLLSRWVYRDITPNRFRWCNETSSDHGATWRLTLEMLAPSCWLTGVGLLRWAWRMAVMNRKLVVIEAPSNLGLKPPAPGVEPGVALMPRTLRELGLYERLMPEQVRSVEAPRYDHALDPSVGVRNAPGLAAYSRDLAAAIGAAVDVGQWPLVLGGDCSVLLGSALSLAQRGRHGLIFIDGHHDLNTTKTTRTGGAAGMDLALVIGHGPAMLTAVGDICPMISAGDVALLGYRDDPAHYDQDADIAQARRSMFARSLEEMRGVGIPSIVDAVQKHFSSGRVAGYWIHVDVDVLLDESMPAVDSRQPGGMTISELEQLLRPLVGSGLALGCEFTIYDPTLDPLRDAGRTLVDLIVGAIRG